AWKAGCMRFRGGGLGGATADPGRVYAFLVPNGERLVEELEFHAVRAGAVNVSGMHWDGAEGAAQVALDSPTDRFDLLLAPARGCFRRAWVPGRAASRMHVTASRLRRPGFVQRGLFEPPGEQAQAVARVKRQVNATVGRFVLRSGATLPLADDY